MYPELAAEYGTLFYPNFLAALTKADDRQSALEEFMQGDGIHPNAKGIELVVEDIGPQVAELVRLAND